MGIALIFAPASPRSRGRSPPAASRAEASGPRAMTERTAQRPPGGDGLAAAVAIVLAASCCALPALIVALASGAAIGALAGVAAGLVGLVVLAAAAYAVLRAWRSR